MTFVNILCVIWLSVTVITLILSWGMTLQVKRIVRSMGYYPINHTPLFEKLLYFITAGIKCAIPLYHLIVLIGLLLYSEQTQKVAIDNLKNSPRYIRIEG